VASRRPYEGDDLSFAKTPSDGQEVDLSALIRRQSRVMRAASNGPFQRPLQPHRRKPRGRLSVCHRVYFGAPGGTRTPDPRLRSPSAFSVFSASCGTGSTLEGTNRLEGSAPPTTPLSSASGARTGKPASLDYVSLRGVVLDVLSSPCSRRATLADSGAGTVGTPRYPMRRIAWHALDPVWQFEDRAPTPSRKARQS
jgi:hypothetical protein